jgi:4-amino-4-deoxy-L-arabinose transferase-like glycosyltransferase
MKTISVFDIEGSRSAGRRRLLVVALVVVGFLLRFDFMRAISFTIDGDEAIVGLMGKHILEGRNIPVFYYGQHYMGSLEAMMASISFLVFGMNSFALQLVPLVWSLALIPLMYLLGASVFGARAGVVAALLTAVPPPALLVWSSKARGGFMEVVVLGAISLVLMVRWLQSEPERLRFPAAIGFVLGIGWWVNNQIAYFMLPIAVMSLVYLLGSRIEYASWTSRLRRLVPIVVVGTGTFLLGGFPYWAYNIRHGFPSAGMFGLASFQDFTKHLEGLLSVALPMLVGAQRFWQKEPSFPGAGVLAAVLYGVPLLFVVLVRFREEMRVWIGRIDRRHPVELLSLFCVACCVVFAVSSYGWLFQAPRYLLPLYVGLFVLLGVAAEYLARWSRGAARCFVVALVGFHLIGAYYPSRAVSGEPFVFGGQRVARDHGPLIASLEKLGVSKVRTNYWIGYRLAFETAERVTFVGLAEPDQVRIPEYEETAGTPVDLLPLVLVESEANIVKPALARLGISFSEEQAGEYRVLYNLTKLYSEPAVVPNEVIVAVEGSGSQSARGAVDGSLESRWGTGAPQSPGQAYTITFAPGTVLAGFEYDAGVWKGDMAKSLSVEAQRADGGVATLLTRHDYRGVRHLTGRESKFTVRFAPVEVRSLTLRQLGKDPVVDWSIAELRFYGTQKGAIVNAASQ